MPKGVEGGAAAATSCDHDRCRRLEAERLIALVAEECAVQEGQDPSAGMCVVDRTSEHEGIRIPGLLDEHVDTVVLDDASAKTSACSTLQAVGDGLGTALEDLAFHALAREDPDHLLKGGHSGPLTVAAAVEKQYLHVIHLLVIVPR